MLSQSSGGTDLRFCFVKIKNGQSRTSLWRIKKVEKTVVFVLAGGSEPIGNGIACEQSGKLEKLFNVTSYVYRFLNNLKAWLGKSFQQVEGELKLEDIENIKRKWVQSEQAIIKQERDTEKLKSSLIYLKTVAKLFR